MDKPKPMVRAANKPIAQHAVESLVANGVKDITFVVGYHREQVQSYFGDGQRFGARIKYAFQDALTGTTQALASIPPPDAPFLLLGADNVIGPGLVKGLLDAANGGPAMVVHRTENASRYGVVTLDGDRVMRIDEKPATPKSRWINTGVYRLDRPQYDLARRLAANGYVGLTDVLQTSIVEGADVRAVKSDDFWSDAVYPWDLLRVHAELFRVQPPATPDLPRAHVESPVLVGDDCVVGPGVVLGTGTCIGDAVEIGAHSVLENCVVYDNVQIGAGSVLRNTIIGEGSRIGPRFTGLSDACDVRASDGWHHLPDFGSVIGEDARIGGGVTALPGTLLGNRARVAHGRTLQGTLEDESIVV